MDNQKKTIHHFTVDDETLKLLRSIDKRLRRMNYVNIPKEFARGLFSGLGFVFGTTVLLAVTILVLRQFITVPVVGGWISDIIDVVEGR